jgi:hypothetical protein
MWDRFPTGQVAPGLRARRSGRRPGAMSTAVRVDMGSARVFSSSAYNQRDEAADPQDPPTLERAGTRAFPDVFLLPPSAAAHARPGPPGAMSTAVRVDMGSAPAGSPILRAATDGGAISLIRMEVRHRLPTPRTRRHASRSLLPAPHMMHQEPDGAAGTYVVGVSGIRRQRQDARNGSRRTVGLQR